MRLPRLLCRLLLLASSLAFSCGCLVSREVVVLGRDGSGTTRQGFVVDLDARERLLDALFLRLGGGGGGGDARDGSADLLRADPFAPPWFHLAAQAAEGYEIEEVEQRVAGGLRTTSLVARFADLAAGAAGGAFPGCAVRLSREEDGSWKLVIEDPWKVATDAGGGEVAGERAVALLEALGPALGGLVRERTIVLPSKVIHTNGQVGEDGRTVTWRVDPACMRAGRDLALEIRFADGEGLGLVTFRHALDLEALSRRLLEPPPQEDLVIAAEEEAEQQPPEGEAEREAEGR